jgi:hypothetical protein
MSQEVFEVPDLVGRKMGLYDSGHPQGPSVTAEKVVDITGLQKIKNEERVLMLYSTVVRGQLVQIVYCYQGELEGSKIHFFPKEEDHDRDEIADRIGRQLGLTGPQLLEIIRQHAPKQ